MRVEFYEDERWPTLYEGNGYPVEVPDEIYERWRRAAAELRDAEDAIRACPVDPSTTLGDVL